MDVPGTTDQRGVSLPLPLRLHGAPGSPYTRKMLALLRYRHLAYELYVGDPAERPDLPRPRVALLPTFYLPNPAGELEAVVDSTPLIRRFEAAFPGRSVVPPDPVLGFLAYLLEDFGDEWLTRAMFHYRWRYAADIEQAGSILPLWRDVTLAPELHREHKRRIAERQIARLYVVGSNDTTAPVIEAGYRRFLGCFDALLQRRPFLFGARPSAADFAIYGQLTQLVRFDPTPAALCLATAPRVQAWTDRVDDLSGTPAPDDGWMSAADACGELGGLLAEVGRTYVPVMLANGAAVAAGAESFETEVDGAPWVQPTFPYQARCLRWVRDEFAALSDGAAAEVLQLLDGSGCERLLEGVR